MLHVVTTGSNSMLRKVKVLRGVAGRQFSTAVSSSSQCLEKNKNVYVLGGVAATVFGLSVSNNYRRQNFVKLEEAVNIQAEKLEEQPPTEKKKKKKNKKYTIERKAVKKKFDFSYIFTI